jgi:hypothetical protein
LKQAQAMFVKAEREYADLLKKRTIVAEDKDKVCCA